MFDGKIESRVVSVGGKARGSKNKNVKDFLSDTKKARDERAKERVRASSSLRIQNLARGWLARERLFKSMRMGMDKKLSDISNIQQLFSGKGAVFQVPLDVTTSLSKQLCFNFCERRDFDRLAKIVKLICASLVSLNAKALLFGSFRPRDTTETIGSPENAHLLLVKKVLVLAIQSCGARNMSVESSEVVLSLMRGVTLVQATVDKTPEAEELNDMLRLHVALHLADAVSAMLRYIITASKTEGSAVATSAHQLKLVSCTILNNCFVSRPVVPSSSGTGAAGEVDSPQSALDNMRVDAVVHTARELLSLPLFAQHYELRPFMLLLHTHVPGPVHKTYWGVILDQLCGHPVASTAEAVGGGKVATTMPNRDQLPWPMRLHILGNFCMQVVLPVNEAQVGSSGSSSSSTSTAAVQSSVLLKTSTEWLRALTNVLVPRSPTANRSESQFSGQNVDSIGSPSTSLAENTVPPDKKRRTGVFLAGAGGASTMNGAWKGLPELPLLHLLRFIDRAQSRSLDIASVTADAFSYAAKHLLMESNGLDSGGGLPNGPGDSEHSAALSGLDEEAELVSKNYELAAGQKKLAFRVAQVHRQFLEIETSLAREKIRKSAENKTAGRGSVPTLGTHQKKYDGSAVNDLLATARQQLAECLSSFHFVAQLLRDKDMLGKVLVDMWPRGLLSKSSTGHVQADQNKNILTLFGVLQLFSRLLSHCPIDERDPQDCDFVFDLLNNLAFGSNSTTESFSCKLWTMLSEFFSVDLSASAAHSANPVAESDTSSVSRYIAGPLINQTILTSISSRLGASTSFVQSCISCSIHLMCSVLYHQLSATDDKQLIEQQKVLKIQQLQNLTLLLKNWLYCVYWVDPPLESAAWDFVDPAQLLRDREDAERAAASATATVGESANQPYDFNNASILFDRRWGVGTVIGSRMTMGAYNSSSNGENNICTNRQKFIQSFLRTNNSITSSNSSKLGSGALTVSTDPTVCVGDVLLLFHTQLAATKLFNHLCIRAERRPAFLPSGHTQWGRYLPEFDTSSAASANSGPADAVEDVDGVDAVLKNPKAILVLTAIPQVIPFKQRVAIFQRVLEKDKARYFSSVSSGLGSRGALAAALGLMEGPNGALQVEVRRDRIVEDAYRGLAAATHKLKGRIQVEFISEQGTREAGIDGGGLFKEFMDTFSKAAFDPEYGMFIPTSTQLLTPNPGSWALGEHHLSLFNFVGKMLGKAVYEKILIESEFSGGFLNVLLGRSNTIDDLFYLDEQLYRSLMQLKQYVADGGDMESVGLFFESTRTVYDAEIVEELMPNGSSVPVTNHNLHAYIHRLAHHKQNVETSEQCRALLSGFREMIPLHYIRMFSPHELQLIISGSPRAIDMEDLQRNVHYASGYHASQPYVQGLWAIVADMSPEDQGNFLKFVTSCSRQPLLGFDQLQPTFCIQKIPQGDGVSSGLGSLARLPSAATCMNLLKLPQYDSVDILKEKLLYAVRSNSGFELS